MNLQPSDAPRGRALAEAAAKVIPGGVNSATRYIGEPYAFTSGPRCLSHRRSTATATSTTTPRSARSCSATTPAVNGRWPRPSTGLDLIGLGVTELEVELAERICSIMPVAESDDRDGQRLGGHGPRVRLARAATGRPADRQVPGRLPRLARRRRPQRHLARDRAYGLDPLSAGILPEALDADPDRRVQRPRLGQARCSTHPDARSPPSSWSRSRTTSARCCRPTSSCRACASCRHRARRLLIFDEVITGFRHALGGYQ